jgi:hypothetical protein
MRFNPRWKNFGSLLMVLSLLAMAVAGSAGGRWG